MFLSGYFQQFPQATDVIGDPSGDRWRTVDGFMSPAETVEGIPAHD
jgi:hypothetical protein